MKVLRDNPFLTGVILLTVIGCGALGFLASGAMTRNQEARDAYGQAVQKLQQLQNRVPFPNEANVHKAEALREAFKQRLTSLEAALAKYQTPINPAITPQEFQDTLRATVNRVASKAEEAGVKLPENFYLGFDQYRDNLPLEKAAPQLAWQLEILSGLVENLIGPSAENPVVRSIDALARAPLPIENSGEAKAAGDLRKLPFQISFTAEQGKFRMAFNDFLKNPQFLIVRSLSVRNSNLQGPPVTHTGSQVPAGQETSPASPASPTALNVILGREVVSVDMHFEIVDFQLAAIPPKTP